MKKHDKNPPIPHPDEDPIPETPAAEAQSGLEERIQELERQLAETEDRWKRAAADLDNFRKRTQRDAELMRRRERENVLLAWLDVIDNMERALTVEGAAANPWYDGVEAVHQQMLGVLKKFDAVPFDARGELFDPERHEAVATANLPDQPEGLIVETIQTGYLMDGKVLRHAKVIPVRHS